MKTERKPHQLVNPLVLSGGKGGNAGSVSGPDESAAPVGHDHTCLNCGRVIEHGEFDCERDADHDFALCDECSKVINT